MSIASRIIVGTGVLGALGYAGYRAFQNKGRNKGWSEARIDNTIEDSFPASDPPAFTAESGVRSATVSPRNARM